MSGITLYHGSYEDNLIKIKNRKGIFGGLFFGCNREAAEAHGAKVYSITLSKNDIANNMDLRRADKACHENELVSDLILEYGCFWNLSEEEQSEVCEIIGYADKGETDWEIQRLRGLFAKELGFKAVEMRDEHGTVYLVIDELELKKCA